MRWREKTRDRTCPTLPDTQRFPSHNPGYPQTNDQPVVCVNAGDAQAYVAWISRETGHAYRLLSETEYEFANRAGTSTAYWWGDDIHGDHASCDACGNPIKPAATVPVSGFAPNPFGLYDTTGNAWSWVSDCYQPTYDGAPFDGSAVTGGGRRRVDYRRLRQAHRPWRLHLAASGRHDVHQPCRHA